MVTTSVPAEPTGRRVRGGSVRPLVAVRRTGSRPPFFCVAAGHSDVLAVAQLGKLLSADQPVYALQPPSGGWDRRLGLRSGPELLDRLVTLYLDSIRSVAPSGPVVVGGNSCGGIIAWELAQRLHTDRADAPTVVLLDTPSRIGRVSEVTHRAGVWMVRRRALGAESRGPRALRVAQAMWGDEGHDIHVRATTHHAPAAYPGRVVLFVSDLWYLHGLAADAVFVAPRRWQELAPGRVEVVRVPGHHLSFIREPLVGGLASRLDALLWPASEGGGG